MPISCAFLQVCFCNLTITFSLILTHHLLLHSPQLHELGHNLNLAHSNEGTQTYADQSGFMGYSYSQDDDKMCFNNAKNWQLGWFSDESIQLDLGDSYVGNLKGQVNYGNGINDKVIVKVKDPNSDRAFYIGYNHKVKHNSNTREGGNQMTIQEYWKWIQSVHSHW